ncbi:hypothetical protein RN001_000091 [Aquatica leii]|uniref:Uncharacterized protein n=1 Tax=Aquatica leii TaxID=1421715 RepID=A0AAN7Q9D7_9COLE|nr:hypothetical protein RN001_000091 [Aquatica leii]
MLLASCGADIKFHRWPSGDYHGSFQWPEIGVQKPSISWSNEGELLATSISSTAFPTVVCVGKTVQTHMIIDVPNVQSLSFSQMIQNHIMLGTTNGNIVLYDIQRQEITKTLPSLPAGITYLEHGAKDSSLAAGCKNEQIYLYNSNCTISSTFCVPDTNNLTAMAYHSTQPNLLAAAGGEGTVVVWDSETGNTKVVTKAHNNVITDVAFSSGEEMVTVGLDHKFNGYDLRTKSKTFSCTVDSKLSAVRILPAGEQIAVASIDGKLYCYDKRIIKLPFNTILAHYPKLISRIAFQSVLISEDTYENLTQSESKVTTVVFNPQPKRKYNSVIEYANAVENVVSTLKTNGRFSPSDYHASASGDYKLHRKNRYSTFAPFNLNKSKNSSCTNVRQLPVMEINNQEHTQSAKFLNRQKGLTDFLRNISCVTNEMSYNFENKIKFAQTKTIEDWFEKIPKSVSQTNLIESGDVSQITKELVDFTKDTFDRINDCINKEFLKIRLSISRGFIKLENKINIRWEEINSTFMRFSSCEIEELDDTNSECRGEKNKVEKIDDNGVEQKSRIPVLYLPIK